jgi:signal peptidase I
VPEDSIWVMGDNRTDSSDSRAFGPIPRDELIGKALFRIWPLDRFGAIDS